MEHQYNFILIILCLTALFSYLNVRFLKLTSSIGLMLFGICFSILIAILSSYFPATFAPLIYSFKEFNFGKIVLDVLLSFLLFAGAMHTDFSLVKQEKNSILLFSIIGVLISTFLIGISLYAITLLFKIEVPLVGCFLFGALVSPTDPIAILSIITKANLPKSIETNIVGESLFNDGIGVVLFISLLHIVNGTSASIGMATISTSLLLFIQETGGGLLLGYILGKIILYFINSIDDYEAEILITIAAVLLGTYLANQLKVSAPLAMVVAGLITGSLTKNKSTSNTNQVYVEKFWHLIDVLLNALLFVLMGLKIVSLAWQSYFLWIIIFSIPLLIMFRYLSLWLPFIVFKGKINVGIRDLRLMTWGALRGGLSIAMAFTLPDSLSYKPLFVTLIYAIVVFSVFAQGLSMPWFMKKFYNKPT